MNALVRIAVHALAVLGLLSLIATCQRTLGAIDKPHAEDESQITIDGWDSGHTTT